MDKYVEEGIQKEVETLLGYIPIFHDDYIESILLESNKITLTFRFLKENMKFFNKIDSKTDRRLKLILRDLGPFKFEGEWFCNNVATLILELTFLKCESGYEIEFSPTCGIYGKINAKSYEFKKIDEN